MNMPMVAGHKWTFPVRFRARAFSWKSSKLACQRLKEATSEIKSVARKDPVLAGEGAVRLMEKLWPALEQVDSSSGALGTAVGRAMDVLVQVVIDAPADPKTRAKWLERLWQAREEDGVDYLSRVGDRWGEVCGSTEVANEWADRLIGIVRSCWNDPSPGAYFGGTSACLSCLVVTKRYDELLELLGQCRYSFWHYREYGVRALLAMGKRAEALKYAEASRDLNQPDSVIDEACENILISSGLMDEAYERYGITANRRATYLGWFRAVTKRYPDKPKTEILADLIAATPGDEGKWFATAKDLKMYELALDLAARGRCDPKTLNRAARDHLESNPKFALGAAVAALEHIDDGDGYEITGLDVHTAYDYAKQAATALGVADQVGADIRRHMDQHPGGFVRQVLGKYLGMGAHQ